MRVWKEAALRRRHGPALHSDRLAFLPRLLGIREGLRPALKERELQYLVALLVAVFVFGYLLYALLRPERF
jgi:K+-transporting ATPase KdpF subunit